MLLVEVWALDRVVPVVPGPQALSQVQWERALVSWPVLVVRERSVLRAEALAESVPAGAAELVAHRLHQPVPLAAAVIRLGHGVMGRVAWFDFAAT